ncbi:MAG: DUF1801 domain-containing protein [Ignavibacteriaceae bacterium]
MNPSEQIDKYILSITDWRGEVLKQLRKIALSAHPDIIEEWKWNSPVWSHKGMICSASAFKEHVGMNFFHGAELKDPKKLFNSGLESKKKRSVRIFKHDSINTDGLKKLILEALILNTKKSK